MKISIPTSLCLLGFFAMGGTASAQTSPEAAAVIETWKDTAGGAARLDGVRSLEFKGSIQMGAGRPPAPLHLRLQKPDKYWMSIQLPAGESLILFDGRQGWYRTLLPGDPGRWEKMDRGESAELATRSWEANHPGGDAPLAGRQVAYEQGKVIIRYKSGKDRVRTFEKGLLLTEQNSDGLTRFADYKSFDGILFATRVVTQSAIGEVVTRFNSVKVNPSFPADQFKAN